MWQSKLWWSMAEEEEAGKSLEVEELRFWGMGFSRLVFFSSFRWSWEDFCCLFRASWVTTGLMRETAGVAMAGAFSSTGASDGLIFDTCAFISLNIY